MALPTEWLGVNQGQSQSPDHREHRGHREGLTLLFVHPYSDLLSGGILKAFRRFLQRTPVYGAYKVLGHYPDYWYWILRGRPLRSPHLLKQKVVREYGERFGLKTLVETGTYYGEMVAAMKEMGRPASTTLHGRFSEFRPLERLVLTQMIDFLPGVEPYESTIMVEFFPSGEWVRMVVTLSPMHDEEFTKLASQGLASQLANLDQRFQSRNQ